MAKYPRGSRDATWIPAHTGGEALHTHFTPNFRSDLRLPDIRWGPNGKHMPHTFLVSWLDLGRGHHAGVLNGLDVSSWHYHGTSGCWLPNLIRTPGGGGSILRDHQS